MWYLTGGEKMEFRQIWLQQFGVFTDWQINRLRKKVAPKMYSNIHLNFARVETGYILGIETNVPNKDEEIINYFVNTLIASI